jgi:hypothetical protein
MEGSLGGEAPVVSETVGDANEAIADGEQWCVIP